VEKVLPASFPKIAWGTISVVLGSIALGLFFLPILSIPVACAGLLASVFKLIQASVAPAPAHSKTARNELRWAIIGCALCSTIIALGFVIAYAPLGETRGQVPPSAFFAPPGSAYIAPPARPN
jgi:hypothetical protein